MINIKIRKILFLMMLFFFVMLIMDPKSVLAAATVSNVSTSDPDAPSTKAVYKGAPAGLELTQFMDKPDAYFEGSGHSTDNSAVIYPAGSAYGNNSDIVQMLSGETKDINGKDITPSKTQISSIWGKRNIGADDDNYFDLSKDQTVSAWIYFGDKIPYKDNSSDNTMTALPDGLAFVLQNDKSGEYAISQANSNLRYANAGQTLGVWGGANLPVITSKGELTNPALKTGYLLGSSAIQNSFALQFDTLTHATAAKNHVPFGDPEYTQDNFFDGMTTSGSMVNRGQHMSWNYPAGGTDEFDSADNEVPANSSNTYSRNKGGKGYYYGLNQRGVIPNMYITGYADNGEANVENAWRHFTFKYTAPTKDDKNHAKIMYYYNDKAYDGTPKPYVAYNKSDNKQEIDITQLKKNLNMEDSKDPNHVRWGFTASTGSPDSAPSTFAIVMQEMPNISNIESDVKLYDLSQYDDDGNKGREISDISASKNTVFNPENKPMYNVGNGDSLRFDYNLNYISGYAGTGNNIETTMNLPKNIDFVPDTTTDLGKQGYIGQIIYSGYPDPADNKTVPISGSDISTNNTTDRKLNLSLNQMKEKGENIKIEMFGKASAVTTFKKVDLQHTSYRSMHYIDDVASPSFIINDKLRLKTTDTKMDFGTINTADGDKINLNLKTNYDNKSAFDKTGLKLYTKIDDNAPTVKTLDTSDGATSYDIPNNLANSTELTANALGVGEHTIKVYEIDSMNRTSDEITYKVNVEGKQLSLDVDDNAGDTDKFQTINSKPSNGYVHRSGTWKVNVLSADTPWTLTASGTNLQMKNDADQQIGPMFYRDKKGNDFSLNTGTPIIASDSNTDHPLEITNISGSWGKNDGILLRDTTAQRAGEYLGKVSWNLTDSVA